MCKLHKKLIRLSNDLFHLPVSNAKHFTFICERNKIISFGYNNAWKTHPAGLRYGQRFGAIHAEWDALRKFPYPVDDLKFYDIINVRLNKRRQPAMAKPCKYCANMLISFNVTKVTFTNEFGEFEQWLT